MLDHEIGTVLHTMATPTCFNVQGRGLDDIDYLRGDDAANYLPHRRQAAYLDGRFIWQEVGCDAT
jgi:hypothetical protein